jgi:hypothetical protein
LVKKALLLTGILSCIFPFSGTFEYIIGPILLFANIKASLHMISISSLTVFIIGLSLHFQNPNTVLITVLLLLNGFVASSRLEMKPIPILLILGFVLGVVPQLLLLVLWL